MNKLRRVALLCCHFVRNYAYYQASWDNKITKAEDEFWVTVQSNFIDIAVLEWTKLFGSYSEKHHWKRIVKDDAQFKRKMLASCNLTDKEFRKLHKHIKDYRDSFLAHLDSGEVMHIPFLSNALELVYFYYSEVTKELVENERRDLPVDIESYYDKCFNKSKIYFDEQNKRQ